jgi:outer membrane lipoprotein
LVTVSGQGDEVMRRHLFLAFSVILMMTGCAHVISEEMRRRVAPELTFKDVLREPIKHRGKVVLWGGVIVTCTNTREGTQIEVFHTALGFRGRPKDIDVSHGRFLALHPEYLDCGIYRKGRKITMSGEIIGQKTLPLDEIEYTYPLISATEIHLWEPERVYREEPGWRFYFGLGLYHEW